MKSRKSCNSISILVVDDDTTCLSFVAALLKKLKYEVVTAKHPNDALCALRIKGEAFDLVVSDVHMPDMNGFELQQAISQEFNLPVVLMSVDSKEVVLSKGMKSGAAFFISKPVSPNDLKDLWQFASMRNRSSHCFVVEEDNPDTNTKRKPGSKEGYEVGTKKPKVIWTNTLHCRFLEAIRTIGLERAVPKKILEAMNVPGLTRENVASHLQKYRIFLKRVMDASYKLEYGDDGGLVSRSTNGSSTTSNSLLMLKKLQNFGDLPAANTEPFLHRDQSHHQLISFAGGLIKPSITTAAAAHQTDHQRTADDFDASSILGLNRRETSSQVGGQIVSAMTSTGSNCANTNYMGLNCYSEVQGNELQDSIFDLDQPLQYLRDSCFVRDGTNRQQLSDGIGDYQDHLQLSELPSIEDQGLVHDDSAFCSMYEPLKAADLDTNGLDQVNIQNDLIQIPQQISCDFTASSIYGWMKNPSYHDQHVFQQVQGSMDCVEYGTSSSQFKKAIESCNERDDEGVLESLLAYGPFGEDQSQTLEGI